MIEWAKCIYFVLERRDSMPNKKIIAISVGIILAVFFMTSFAGGTDEKASVVTRSVVFTDSYDGHNIASYDVELGKASNVPEVQEHEGWMSWSPIPYCFGSGIGNIL